MTMASNTHPPVRSFPCASDIFNGIIAFGFTAVGGAGAGIALYGVAFLVSAVTRIHYMGVLDNWDVNLMTSATAGATVGVVSEATRRVSKYFK